MVIKHPQAAHAIFLHLTDEIVIDGIPFLQLHQCQCQYAYGEYGENDGEHHGRGIVLGIVDTIAVCQVGIVVIHGIARLLRFCHHHFSQGILIKGEILTSASSVESGARLYFLVFGAHIHTLCPS